MRIHPLATSCALALPLLATGCSTPRVDLTPRWGTFDIDGTLGISSGGVAGVADLETAGLQQDDSVFGLRGDFDWGPMHLMLSTQQSSHDGSGTLDATIDLGGGPPITAGTQVDSELSLGLHDAAFTFDLIPTDLVELGLGLGVSYVDFSAAFQDSLTANRVETEQSLPIPVLALRAGVRLWRADVSVQAGGIQGTYDGNDLLLIDVDAMARVRILGDGDHLTGHLTAGYRWLDLELDYEDGSSDVDADLGFQGPYVGLTLSI